MSMIDDRYQADKIPSVDMTLVAEAALLTADALTSGEHSVEVVFAPGDATEYRIVLSRSRRFVRVGACADYQLCGPGELVVAMLTPCPRVYTWGPGNSSWSDWRYVAEHWSLEEWSARVLSAFLNLLREQFSEIAGVTL